MVCPVTIGRPKPGKYSVLQLEGMGLSGWYAKTEDAKRFKLGEFGEAT